MEAAEVDKLVRQLATGFETLHEEYKGLYGRHQALERKLATAREQYNELAKLYGSGPLATPPLSLSSSPGPHKEELDLPTSASEILEKRDRKEAADTIRTATAAADSLRYGLPVQPEGVKIWSGPSADRQEGSSCAMPSISESPLEQDFTVEGKPSKLGCPFASMANKRLSSHAASVLSRYNRDGSGVNGSIGAQGSIAAASTPLSTASRVNGRESMSRRQSRRTSMVDPIKAEICGMSDHGAPEAAPEAAPESGPEPAPSEKATKEPTERPDNAEMGVCPIRFLDQHSPEEVATYFEKHKHELPRSHEVCVMRYQSNEEQIKQLDAKYGNLVSMIQGLGQKHKTMLPADPDDAASEGGLSDAKVRKWASSVSAQAPEPGAEEEPEERQPHFERPLRDIRVGESPSRPWGIPVPVKYLEKAESETSSKPAEIAGPAPPDVPPSKSEPAKRPAGKCPFGHGAAAATGPTTKPVIVEPPNKNPEPDQRPPAAAAAAKTKAQPTGDTSSTKEKEQPQMIFTGPVFIGYSPEDAARILSGLRMNQQSQ